MSSTLKTKGENITNAVQVLQETYKNLDLLFAELDRVGKEEGFVSLTPRFLRWKSDAYPEGWLTTNFIKLYQKETDSPLPQLDEVREGTLYGIEVELQPEIGYPIISLNEYSYDFTYWNRLPSISDHWLYHNPFYLENEFNIKEENGKWTSTPLDKYKKRYWGLLSATGQEFPLAEISSPEDIRIKLFGKI
ncbi:hypothetical protein P4361_00400 [Fictibacillus sp. B-59209]|uniref:hypothetical protein n=1 Tax=Fictibacillus sp. B-59209 TaxID=3024873 RepID=UPI002E1A45CD|nr:hypothetical protein [Fictibacillus sp. B-59209]